jgi:hypothetical protein
VNLQSAAAKKIRRRRMVGHSARATCHPDDKSTNFFCSAVWWLTDVSGKKFFNGFNKKAIQNVIRQHECGGVR